MAKKLPKPADNAVASVRFIPTDHNTRVGWTGNKPALVIPGENVLYCIVYEVTEVTVRELPLALLDKCNHAIDPQNPGKPYPIERYLAFIERVRAAGKPIRPEVERLIRVARRVEGLTEFPRTEADAAAKPEPKPDRPAKSASRPAPDASGPSLIARLAAEFGLEPPKFRKALRAAGLRAPYTDEEAIRAALAKSPLIASVASRPSKKKGK